MARRKTKENEKGQEQNYVSGIPNISLVTHAILQLADSIPGYSRNKLIEDCAPLWKGNKMFTQSDVAEHLDVTIQTIKNWNAIGYLIPTLKLPGGTCRYSISDIEVFKQTYKPNWHPRKAQIQLSKVADNKENET